MFIVIMIINDSNVWSLIRRLNLPGNVVENGNAAAKYDADSGTFELVLPKEVPGEEFPDLQLLTKLLAPKVKPEQEPFIENIDDGTWLKIFMELIIIIKHKNGIHLMFRPRI